MPDKLLIESYGDNAFAKKGPVFTAQINPSSYKFEYKIAYRKKGVIDGAGLTPSFQTMVPMALNLVLEFDGTGVVPGAPVSVAERLAAFRTVAYEYVGGMHRPRYLWILWGKLSFKCVLNTYQVDTALFDPSGNPLRAKLSATFTEFRTPKQIAAQAANQSADLTHRRTVVDGDTLPLLCDEIYRDASLYLLVARHNRLGNFRRLEPGTLVAFPPLRELTSASGGGGRPRLSGPPAGGVQ